MNDFNEEFRRRAEDKGLRIGVIAQRLGICREALYIRLTKKPEFWTLTQLVKVSEILDWDLAEIINILTGGKLNANGRIHNQLHSTCRSQRDARPVSPSSANKIIRWKT